MAEVLRNLGVKGASVCLYHHLGVSKSLLYQMIKHVHKVALKTGKADFTKEKLDRPIYRFKSGNNLYFSKSQQIHEKIKTNNQLTLLSVVCVSKSLIYSMLFLCAIDPINKPSHCTG